MFNRGEISPHIFKKMALPKIQIKYLNGQLGTEPASADGLLLLVVVGATAVSSQFVPGITYKLYSVESLECLGVSADNNKRLHELVVQFYNEAPAGTPLLIAGYESSKTFTALCDKNSGPLKELLQEQKGEVRGLVLAGIGKGTVEKGLNKDVFSAIPKAQALAESAAAEMYAPIFIALEGAGYMDSAALKDLSKETNNRVCIVLGDVKASSNNAAMGTFAGCVAKAPVQRNIGKVAEGALAPVSMFLGAKSIESAQDDISTIYDKGYICPRTYVGKSGYFFADDRTACVATDDYAHLASLRTVDKAARVAYQTVLSNMLSEIECNEDGTMDVAIIKSWQAAVESNINSNMTAKGELSQEDGRGCRCYIDPGQNVLATSAITMSLKLRPFAYARDITVNLGFLVTGA